MNRFLRTAYSTTLVYLYLTLFVVTFSGVSMPFPAFSCLYFGLLICLLPGILRKLEGLEVLFTLLGAVTAGLGFLPIALAHCPVSHWVLHLAGIAAAAVFLPILRHKTTHDRFMAKYQFSAVFLLLVIGLLALAILPAYYADGEASGRHKALRLAVNTIVPYAIVLLMTGVLLLRGLRAGEGIVDEQAFNRRQLRDTLIFAVLVTLFFAVDPFLYLQKAAYFLINDVIKPFGRYLLSILAALLRLISVKRPDPEPQPTDETTEPGGIPPVAENTEPEPENYDLNDAEVGTAIFNIFAAVLALILIIILVIQIRKLIRRLRERGIWRGDGYPNEVREALPREEGSQEEDKPKKRSADPRERIRWLYGEFLKHLKKHRIAYGKTDTCGEIETRAERHRIADPSVLSDLTELYEEARYREEEPPTEDDVQAMKDLVNKVRKKT